MFGQQFKSDGEEGEGPKPFRPHGDIGLPDVEKESLLEMGHQLIITCILMICFVVYETWQEHKHFKFGIALAKLFL